MDYIRIDLNAYPRKAHFDYFSSMAYPYVGMTVQTDITELLETVRRRKLPFFLTVLYLAAAVANSVPELRRRIKDGGIIEYRNCGTSHTVALPNGTYGYCALDCSMPLEQFLPCAADRQAEAIKTPSLEDGTDADGLFFVSSVPWVSYTAIMQPVPYPADSNPRITFGRYFTQEGRTLMPVTLLAHHALVDGKHIADFYENLGLCFQRLTAQSEG